MRFECRAEVILCENLSLAPFDLSWFDDIIEVGVTKKYVVPRCHDAGDIAHENFDIGKLEIVNHELFGDYRACFITHVQYLFQSLLKQF